MKKIKAALTGSKAASLENLKKRLEETHESAEGRALEAQVRDVVEARMNVGYQVRATLGDLGLKEVLDGVDQSVSKKMN